MSSVSSPYLYSRRFDREGHSHLFTLDARYADIGVAQTSVEFPVVLGGVGLQGSGYDVGSKFSRGGIMQPCHSGLFGSDCVQHGGRTGKTHRDHLKCCCSDASIASITSALIEERLEHELETNRINNGEERCHERVHFWRKKAYLFT